MTAAIRSPAGCLFGVSLGPGDPELITRRAWSALTSGARWAYPVKGRGAISFALDIVARAGLPIPSDAEPLHFPMTSDPEALSLAWERTGRRCAELLVDGRDLLFLVEGDASTYSTFGHLVRAVRAQVPDVAVETIPGVPSYTAAAARLGAPLVEEGGTLAVIPAAYGVEVIDRMIDAFDTLVLLKVNPLLDQILTLLEHRGLLGEARFVERVGTPEERVVELVETLRGERVPYLSLLLVRNPGRVRGPQHRGCAKVAERTTDLRGS
ncbi:precorrin-2 C(20)-methyltransferase [Imhoffiella purpurea]|uniref:Cobalt-precorrin-2 C20-methyltransferase n=1 Tax=Imhoffiella purpurea TaxID=1249627 RepID=W9V4L9_9GAMM|nr:precorrin-2 C(20)-methyltransferase [Imhoffiella purpurea]EXJ14468.1 Cobalt-precorrin-2 C20-methyltransferase [Imhoffiella purpurea]